LSSAIGEIEQALTRDTDGRFACLTSIFGLSDPERDLLEACAAVALDPGLRDVCACLTDHARISERLVARLYRQGRAGAWSGDSALFRWEIVRRCDGTSGEEELALDPIIRDWFRGLSCHDELLGAHAAVRPPLPPLAGWPFRPLVETLRAHLTAEFAKPVRVIVTGARGSGRRTFAAAVSAALGFRLFAIDSGEIEDAFWSRAYVRAHRYAFLNRCALAWHGESAARRKWPGSLPAFPLQFVTCETAHDALRHTGILQYTVDLRPLSLAESVRVWNEYAPTAWNRTEVEGIAQRYRVPVGDIASVCAACPESPDEAGQRVREASRSRLSDLAQCLPCSFTWDDLVLPERVLETLRDLVYEAQHRPLFWEQPGAQRLFPLGRGLIGLFSGLSGTGKTMAAQVIAASLGYDLYRIDLSAVVSKYVGETSQNVDRVLRRAADMDVVLFFDEADAMFARRTSEIREAQDKFANTDAAHLLQAIESYPGVALLATNQKNSVDQAFLRRIRYMIEFPKPEMPQRLEIWRRVVGELAGTDTAERLHTDLAAIARDLDSTGAQIKNAVLGALFLSRRTGSELAVEHLLLGLERELAKEGRNLSAKERERMRRP